jgi:uncharacterized protein YkwD
MVRILATAFLAALLLAPTAATAPQSPMDSSLVRQINAVRAARGLPPLTLSPSLTLAAQQHTREMGVDGYFEHSSYDKSPFWKRIEKWYPSTGWSNWAVGENLVYQSPDLTVMQALRAWMTSPEHRANLLSREWREIGLSAMHFDSAPGPYAGDPVTIVTADFGARS